MASFSAKESDLQDILPDNTLETRVPQAQVERTIAPAPSRYRNEISKYILRRSHDCIHCGKCAELCPYGVHVRKEGYKYFCEPKSHLCIGPACEKTEHYCVAACPKNGSADHRESHDGDPRRFPLDGGPDPGHLADGRDGQSASAGVRVRLRVRQFRRRVRQAAVQVPGQAAGERPEGPDRHEHRAEQPGRRPAADQHRRSLVWRRHVVRLGQQRHAAFQGAQRPWPGTPSPAPAKAATWNACGPTTTT